jgi:alpha-L-rhamnosidase
MVDKPQGRPLRTWTMSRRQLLGGGLMGAAGLAVGPVAAPARAGAESPTTAADPGGAQNAAGPGVQYEAGQPLALTVDGLEVPIGLDPEDVYFAWLSGDSRRRARQSAYRIRVAGPTGGPGAAHLVWDSGPVASSEQAFVAYGGRRLAHDSAYRWTVQTWDAAGRSGPMSAPAAFETGLGNGDWLASWIGRAASTEPDQYTYARREFTLRQGPIVRARAFVSGDQQYELYVNGQRAGKGQAYSYPDSMYYETLDVTGLLLPGAANAAGLVTSWQGPTKGHPAGQPGVIAQINVHYADGRVETHVTDRRWRVLQGPWLPGTQRDLEGDLVDFTENIDGPAMPIGWQLPGFDDRSWAKATVFGRAPTPPWTSLVPVRTRIVEHPVPPVSLTTLSSGAVVADFGKVYAAVPTVAFHRGVAGRTVTMRAGYLLDEPTPGQPFTGVPGQVSIQHGTQHTDMSYSYVQRGGEEEFHPFDYLGFRYFQIDNPGESLSPADIVALTRHTAPPPVAPATFSSDQPVLDAEFDLGAHSALFTAQEQYIDTPTREKGPWLFDGFNESRTAMALFGEQNLTRKSLLEFAQSQARYWPNGALNKIYPTGLGALDINEFTEVYPEWVWQYWMYTGDRALLSMVYGVLTRISDYVQRSVSAGTGLVTALPATSIYYSYPVVTRLNVLGVNVFRRTADVAEELGRPTAEVAQQHRRARMLTAAVNRRLTRPDGTYVDGLAEDGTQIPSASQTANACAVSYQVVPGDRLATVAGYVSSLGMQTPPQTAPEVLRAMAMAGLYDDLVATLVDATIDGWANILTRGATFTWEVWNPSDANGDSMSHGWGSPVALEIQRTLLGVQPLEPGFARFEVSPPSGGPQTASGTVPTPRGTIAVAWARPQPAGSGFSLSVTVPSNTVATATVPAAQPSDVTEGGEPLAEVEGIRLLGTSDGSARLEVGAGTYHIHTAASQ